MLIKKCTDDAILHWPAMKYSFSSRTVSCSVLFCYCSFDLKTKPYNKSFIYQACSVKMAGYWPRSFFCVFTKTKKRTLPISSHLDLKLGQ